MESIICSQCKREFVHIEGKSGKQRLVVNPPEMAITIITKDPLIGEIECPKCHHRTTITAEWMQRLRRF